MNLDSIIGNERIKKALEKPFHAYIISGARGSGKHTLLRLLVASQVCVENDKPCLKCNQCVKFLEGNHVDIKNIQSNIPVKDLKTEISDLAYKPNEAAHRVFIIDNAENLSVSCQNILLKSIEEPPLYSVFFLVTDSENSLLETVRSRCMSLTMQPLKPEQISKFLNSPRFARISDEDKAAAIAFSGGFIGAAIDFLSKEKSELFKLCDSFATALSRNRKSEALKLLNFKKREDLHIFISELHNYFCVHLRSQITKNTLGLNADVRAIDEKRLAILCERLEKLKFQTSFNINITLFSTILLSECYNACWRFV